jgi:hypothetical protein
MKKMNNILKMISQMDANANEIKLAKHEVQLSIKDNASKLVTSYYGLTDNVDSKYSGILKEVRGLIDKIDEAIKVSNEMPNVITKYEQLAKELGIDVNNIQELKDMKLAVKDVAQYKGLIAKLKTL